MPLLHIITPLDEAMLAEEMKNSNLKRKKLADSHMHQKVRQMWSSNMGQKVRLAKEMNAVPKRKRNKMTKTASAVCKIAHCTYMYNVFYYTFRKNYLSKKIVFHFLFRHYFNNTGIYVPQYIILMGYMYPNDP